MVSDIYIFFHLKKARTTMRTIIIAPLYCLLLICLLAGFSRACTCFSMDTPAGPIFGSNLDLFIPGDGLMFVNQRGIAKEGMQASTTGEKIKWTSKYGSVTFNLAGREMAFGGMNEAGLVVGTMELAKSEFHAPDQRPALSIGFWVQYVLDTCGTVEEAVKVDAKVRIQDSAPSQHFLIVDAEGNCAAIEWFDGKYTCYTGDSLPVKVMSNMPYARALAAQKRGGARWWWSNPGQSAERFAGAQARCQSYDPVAEPDAIGYAFGTLVDVVSAPHTKWSIVYDIPKREIWYGTVVSRPVKHLAFKNLDFSCEGPLLMLDVNAALEGDIEKHFTPYDHDVNMKVFQTLCERYEIEVSQKDAAEVMQHFESFKCATEGTHKTSGEN